MAQRMISTIRFGLRRNKGKRAIFYEIRRNAEANGRKKGVRVVVKNRKIKAEFGIISAGRECGNIETTAYEYE